MKLAFAVITAPLTLFVVLARRLPGAPLAPFLARTGLDSLPLR